MQLVASSAICLQESLVNARVTRNSSDITSLCCIYSRSYASFKYLKTMAPSHHLVQGQARSSTSMPIESRYMQLIISHYNFRRILFRELCVFNIMRELATCSQSLHAVQSMVSTHWVVSAACCLNASLVTGITDVAPPISLQLLLQLWNRSVASCLSHAVTCSLQVLTFNFYRNCGFKPSHNHKA